MRYIIIFLSLILTLYINQDILSSFEKVENKFNDKIWRTTMYSPQQNFFNSIWLTDNEYNLLVKFGEVKTKYKNAPLIIKLE